MARDVFGEGAEELPILLDEVGCVGSEKSIEDCEGINWGESDCDHQEDVGVRCAFRIDAPQSNRTTEGILPLGKYNVSSRVFCDICVAIAYSRNSIV